LKGTDLNIQLIFTRRF